MADNFTYKNASDTTETGAADDIGGVKFPRVKIIHGADGTNDGDVSAANPLPVVQTGALPAGTNNIGDVDVASLPGTVAADISDILAALADKLAEGGSVEVAALSVDETTATALAVSSSGDNTVVSVDPGATLRLGYICLSAPSDNSGDVTALVKLGAATVYRVTLAPGSIWARNLSAGRRFLAGAAGDDLIVNLSAAETVDVSAEYDLV